MAGGRVLSAPCLVGRRFASRRSADPALAVLEELEGVEPPAEPGRDGAPSVDAPHREVPVRLIGREGLHDELDAALPDPARRAPNRGRDPGEEGRPVGILAQLDRPTDPGPGVGEAGIARRGVPRQGRPLRLCPRPERPEVGLPQVPRLERDGRPGVRPDRSERVPEDGEGPPLGRRPALLGLESRDERGDAAIVGEEALEPFVRRRGR